MGLALIETLPRRLGCPIPPSLPRPKISQNRTPPPFWRVVDRSIPKVWGKEKGGTPNRHRSQRVPHPKCTVQLMTTEQEIKDHTQGIEAGRHTCHAEACPHCAAQETFRVHQRRRRSFRLVVEQCVRVFRSWVLRFKCPSCHRTFTDYPPFRSATQTICQFHGAGAGEGLLGQPQVISSGSSGATTVARL